MAKRKTAPVAPINAAPGGYPPPAPFTAPPGGIPGWTAANSNNAVSFTPPPPQGDRNPFLNAQWLWDNGDQSNPLRPVMAKITGLRQATGGNPAFANRGGFFLDLLLQNGTKATARVNIGDQRHQRLYAKFQDKIVGRTVMFRLSHPGDNTKGPWTIE